MGPVSWVSVLVVGSGGNLMVAGEWALFFLCTLGAQKLIFGGSESLIAVISLFVDITGDIPFYTTHKMRKCKEVKLTHPPACGLPFWGISGRIKWSFYFVFLTSPHL